MITQWFVDAIWGVVEWVLNLLPNVDPPDLSSFASGVGTALGWTAWANQFVPVTVAATLFAIWGVLWVGFSVWNVLVWALSKLHILGGASD